MRLFPSSVTCHTCPARPSYKGCAARAWRRVTRLQLIGGPRRKSGSDRLHVMRGRTMSQSDGKKGARARGMTLIEVLVAMVLLVLVFIFVAENMIASSWAESKSGQRSEDISAANYFMALMSGDGKLWSGYPDTPVDVCGNAL